MMKKKLLTLVLATFSVAAWGQQEKRNVDCSNESWPEYGGIHVIRV